MRERILRDKDERCYQPRIHTERIKALYQIGIETGLPMTVLVDYSIGKFIQAYEKKKRGREALQDELAWHLKEQQGPKFEDEEFEPDLDSYLEPYQNDPYGENY